MLSTSAPLYSFTTGVDGPFHLGRTLICGQAFRWSRARGPEEAYVGAVEDSLVRLEMRGRRLSVTSTSARVDRRFIRAYLGLDDDLEAVYRRLFRGDPVMREALRAGRGMRLMRQPVWETLASFILSSASNIPRIRRCVESVARGYGRKLPRDGRGGRRLQGAVGNEADGKGGGVDTLEGSRALGGAFATALGEPLSPWSFPSPQRMLSGGRECMAECRLGYREGYLWESAEYFVRDGLEPEALRRWNPGRARGLLTSLPGVGEKVADCVMLFALGRKEAFPTDVWIRRAVSELYLGGEDISSDKAREWGMGRWGADAGYAQQYLYLYMREGMKNGWGP